MKIFKQVVLAIIICFALTSCEDLFGYDEEPEIAFDLVIADNTVFSTIELFCKKDSSGVPKYRDFGSMADSLYTDHKLPDDLPSFGVAYRDLEGLENGTFEIRATKPDSSQLIKEFGVIKGDQTQNNFHIVLTNNEIFVK